MSTALLALRALWWVTIGTVLGWGIGALLWGPGGGE